MTITVDEIVRRVRSAIDELMVNQSQFLTESTDEANLTNVIVDKIGYALMHVIGNAPIEKLDDDMLEVLTAEELQGFSIDATSKVATLVLPDYLRIVEARLSSWSHFPIPESDMSQVYLMQQDQYARGSWDRPVNILTHNGSGKRILEMYCAKEATGANKDTLIFVFVRKPVIHAATQDPPAPAYVDCPAKLEAALIYQVAGLAMVAFREEVAKSLFQIADRYLYNDDKGGSE